MYWTLDKIETVSQVMEYATSYDFAVHELRKFDIVTNFGVLVQVVRKHKIKKPHLKWGGNRK
jgi:hypothetical protein